MAKRKQKSKPKDYGDDIMDVVTTGAKVTIGVGAATALMSGFNK